jgi:hypothetical protein
MGDEESVTHFMKSDFSIPFVTDSSPSLRSVLE